MHFVVPINFLRSLYGFWVPSFCRSYSPTAFIFFLSVVFNDECGCFVVNFHFAMSVEYWKWGCIHALIFFCYIYLPNYILRFLSVFYSTEWVWTMDYCRWSFLEETRFVVSLDCHWLKIMSNLSTKLDLTTVWK